MAGKLCPNCNELAFFKTTVITVNVVNVVSRWLFHPIQEKEDEGKNVLIVES